MRRTLGVGVGLAALYLAVVTATMAVSRRPVLPLFDGLTPPPPYQWVKPPPGYGFNTKPEPAEVSVALTDTGSVPDGPTGVNGQVVLNLPAGAVPARSGDTAVKITIKPLDPARLDPLPPGLIPDGNAYDIRLRYQPSGRAIDELAVPGNIILATPEPASALLVAAAGRPWEAIETQRVGGPDSVGGPFVRAGHYVAAIPGAAAPRGGTSWLATARRVLIVVLSVALVVNLAGRVRQRRFRSTTPTKGRRDMADCVFCRIVAGEIPTHRVHDDDLTIAFMDIGQVNPGHVLVAVKSHAETILDISSDEAAAAFRTAHQMARAVEAAFAPEGLTILQANREAGFQTVSHFHLHVLPRHTDDGVTLTWPAKNPPAATLADYAARLRAQ